MNAVATLWLAALTVAGLGTWLLFDAAPGVNWGAWTLVASAGGVAFGRMVGGRPGARTGLCGLACALAVGAAITADPVFHAFILLAVPWLLAVAMRLARDPRVERIGLPFVLAAPLWAMAHGFGEAARRAGELGGTVGTERHRPALRGSMLALVVVGVFATILAGADPILAALRDGLVEILERLEFIPRLVFFGVLVIAGVGSYGLTLRPGAAAVPSRPAAAAARWSDVERLIVLCAVALLFTTFLVLQLSYLFDNAPAVAGSGITFAEYARRGFAELTIVASLCTCLILGLERSARRGPREAWARGLALALIGELVLLLVSAFRRLWLYEAAYGFTTARLYGQVYMVVAALALLMLAVELVRVLDAGRLLRRAAAAGAVAVIALSFWNHEGWIARRNIERAAGGGTLDARYLVWGLSVNAVPAIAAVLDGTPSGEALAGALRDRYARRSRAVSCRWFEWNLRQRHAVDALHAAGIALEGPAVEAAVRGCVRIVRREGD